MSKAILSLVSLFLLSLARPALAQLVVSEIMYDVSGADDGQEWVEIYNSGGPIDFRGGSSGTAWRFFDGSNHILNLYQGTTTIAASEFFIVADDGEQFLSTHPGFAGNILDTSMSLNNSGDSVALSLDGGQIYVDRVDYESGWGANGNDFSLEKIDLSGANLASNWQESAVLGGTPGAANSQSSDPPPARGPEARAICPSSLLVEEAGNFDASASSDPQGLTLTYLWDFSDGYTATTTVAEHSFSQAGTYPVSLTIDNGQIRDSDNCSVEVVASDDGGAEDDEESGGGGGGASGGQVNQNWRQILISEFMPNPKGSDEGEWIELYNSGSQTVDLSGFALQDNSTRIYMIEDLSIAANSYLVFYKNTTALSLNNTGGDAVKLYSPSAEPLEAIFYTDTAPEGKSYARNLNNFSWTISPSLGEVNVFVSNQKPLAKIKIKSKKLLAGEKIIFSAEDSSDPEESALTYSWDFGDDSNGDERTENHIYESGGTFQVKLVVRDDQGVEAEAVMVINVESPETEIKLNETSPIDFSLAELIISEFIPDPAGSDDGEWIELYNNSSKDINLSGWQLDDGESGSKPYIFPAETKIMIGQFLVVDRSLSKITLNNSQDEVRLLTPLGDLWQAVSYDKVPEGQSQAWDLANQEWYISTEPSPDSANVVSPGSFQLSSNLDLSELDKKSEVWLQAVALYDVDPNSRSLYVAQTDGQSMLYDQALELYFYKKAWPDIKRGQVLEVSGSINKISTGPRLKINTPEQIYLSDVSLDWSRPDNVDPDSLSEDMTGQYVSTSGTVVKKNGKNIYLALAADEEPLMRAYLDFDYKDLAIDKGAEMLVSGILQNSASGLKLLVKDKDDVLLSQQVLGYQEDTKDISTSTKSLVTPNRQEKTKYILGGLVGLAILIGLGQWWREHRKH